MRNPQRNRQQWLTLFEKQQQSGLTAAEFCREQSIHLQTYYARRSDLRQQIKQSGFVKVQKSTTTTVKRIASEDTIKLSIGGAYLSLPISTDANWLAAFVKALA